MSTKIPRNIPCPCKSGKKYKKCCLIKKLEAEKAVRNAKPQGKFKSRKEELRAKMTMAALGKWMVP